MAAEGRDGDDVAQFHASLQLLARFTPPLKPAMLSLQPAVAATIGGRLYADWRGETVFDVTPRAAASHHRGPSDGRAHVVSLSPRGASAAGNVSVLVSGAAFQDHGDVRCRFGLIEVRGRVHHQGAITCVAPPFAWFAERSGPPPKIPFGCMVDVTMNGVDYTGRTGVPFMYYNVSQVAIATMRPSGGRRSGGTLVRLRGTSFVDYGGAAWGPKCRFGDLVVRATLVSHEEVRCVSPATELPEGTDVPVWVSLNGYTDERGLSAGSEPLSFRYLATAQLDRLHPYGSPAAGGALLTITGAGFVDHSGASSPCSMGHAVLCGMHRDATGVVRADVWHRGLACVFEGRSDVYGRPIEEPVVVPATRAGGENETSLTCRTPDAASLRRLATAVGPWCAQLGHTPWCADPAYAAAGVLAVAVRVTLNGDETDVSSASLAHMLFPDAHPRLDYVHPWGGPAPGGTAVSIVGDGLLAFGDRPVCRFGSIEVPAQVGGLNDTQAALDGMPLHTRVALHHGRSVPSIEQQPGRLMTCTSPPGHAFGSRAVRLSVSLDGEHFSSDTLSWRYTSVWVSHAYPPGGPLSGGTAVLVRGGGFNALGLRGLGGLRCVFGTEVVAASLAAEPHAAGLRCASPPASQAGTVSLGISVNGQLDAAAVPPGVNFTFFDESDVVISSLTPTIGPLFGGTAVTLRGVGFVGHGTVLCRFGHHEPSNATLFATSTMLVCRSPPHDFDTVEQLVDHVPVRIGLNGDETQLFDASGTPNGQAQAAMLDELLALPAEQFRADQTTAAYVPPRGWSPGWTFDDDWTTASCAWYNAIGDGTHQRMGSRLTRAACAAKVFGERPEANGAVWVPGGGECYAALTSSYGPHPCSLIATSLVHACKFERAVGPCPDAGAASRPQAPLVQFTYARPCRGPEHAAFYDSTDALDVVRRFAALSRPNLTALDVDGDGGLSADEIARAVNASMRGQEHVRLSAAGLQVALDEYAASTCFPFHESTRREAAGWYARADD